MDILIYGTGLEAHSLYVALREIAPRRKILGFLVPAYETGMLTFAGQAVMNISDLAAFITSRMRQPQVFITVANESFSDIEDQLDAAGCTQHIRIDSERLNELLELYYMRKGLFTPLHAFPPGFSHASLNVFRLVSSRDKKLSGRMQMPIWTSTLEVGAALSDHRIAEYADNIGDNISTKNRNYYELTALYWIWKNIVFKQGYLPGDPAPMEERRNGYQFYYGVAHYRRTLMIGEDDIQRLRDNEIDVILPFPLICTGDLDAYRRQLIHDADWSACTRALAELSPADAEALEEIMSQPYIYLHNIMIAEEHVWADYCEWLFPVLQRTEEYATPQGVERADHYIGYLGHFLMTLYFLKNPRGLNIAHSGCKIFS